MIITRNNSVKSNNLTRIKIFRFKKKIFLTKDLAQGVEIIENCKTL